MDLASVVGMILCWVVVIGAILIGGDMMAFINIPSFMIVIGGAVTATILRYQFNNVMAALKTCFFIAFKGNNLDARGILQEIHELATLARAKGVIALDGVEIKNECLKKGIQLVIDGLDAEFVKEALFAERDLFIERLETGEKIARAIADAAPAFGMIGTLIGLVQMLSTMDDPSTIGPSMAVALLTTLYGALISNVVFIPIGDKIAFKLADDFVAYSVAVEGILQIQKQQNPDMIVEYLNAFLSENSRIKTDD